MFTEKETQIKDSKDSNMLGRKKTTRVSLSLSLSACFFFFPETDSSEEGVGTWGLQAQVQRRTARVGLGLQVPPHTFICDGGLCLSNTQQSHQNFPRLFPPPHQSYNSKAKKRCQKKNKKHIELVQ